MRVAACVYSCWEWRTNGRKIKDRDRHSLFVVALKMQSYNITFLFSKVPCSKCVEVKVSCPCGFQAKPRLGLSVKYECWLPQLNNIFTLVDFDPSWFVVSAAAVCIKTCPFLSELAVVAILWGCVRCVNIHCVTIHCVTIYCMTIHCVTVCYVTHKSLLVLRILASGKWLSRWIRLAT